MKTVVNPQIGTGMICAVAAIVGLGFALLTPYSIDYVVFRDAGRALLEGRNPYAVYGYYSPLYVAAGLSPLSLLPFDLGRRLQIGLMAGAAVIALWRLRTQIDLLGFCLASPLLIFSALQGNLDALVVLGVTLPPPWNLWLLLVKPQLGLFAAGLILYRSPRRIRLAIPLAAMGGLSFALGMGRTSPIAGWWNASLWPWGLLIALPLGWYAFRRNDRLAGLGVMTFAFPYVTSVTLGASLLFISLAKLRASLQWLQCRLEAAKNGKRLQNRARLRRKAG